MESRMGSGLFWRLLRRFSTNEINYLLVGFGSSDRETCLHRWHGPTMGRLFWCTFRELFFGVKGQENETELILV